MGYTGGVGIPYFLVFMKSEINACLNILVLTYCNKEKLAYSDGAIKYMGFNGIKRWYSSGMRS
jgi:hypothetical protein